MADTPKNLKQLEDATPELIRKLAELAKDLSPAERAVFSEIIESAAIHTQVVQAHDEGAQELVYAKPKSVHSTIGMKRQFAELPSLLGLETDGK